MSEYAMAAGGRLVAVLIALALLGAVLWGLRYLLRRPWWPSVIFQTGHRPDAFAPWLMGTFCLAAIFGFGLLGSGGLGAAVLIWLIWAPAVVVRRATRRAWKRDTPAQREQALAVRNRIRAAAGEAELTAEVYWDQYVLDRAKAERQATYYPPGN